MPLESWLEDLLPTKWSRRFGLATVVLAGAAFGVPSILPASFLPVAPVQVFLIRLVLLLFIASVGLVAVLSTVIRAYHAQAAAHLLALAAMEHTQADESASRSNRELHKPINYPYLGIGKRP